MVGATIKKDRKPKEKTMTKINHRSMLTGAAVFGAAAILSISFFGGSAEASVSSRLMKCNGQNAERVVNCCEQVIAKKRPLWMINTSTSCHAAVVCRMVKVSSGLTLTHVAAPRIKKICAIVQQAKVNDGGGNKEPKRDRGTPNTRNTPNNNPNGSPTAPK